MTSRRLTCRFCGKEFTHDTRFKMCDHVVACSECWENYMPFGHDCLLSQPNFKEIIDTLFPLPPVEM